jgi:hypothetical protein
MRAFRFGRVLCLYSFCFLFGTMTRAVVPAPAHIKVDHASVCGSQLDAMRESFAAAGLATDYGGPHANGGTQMALLGFDDGSYLELIAPQKPGMAADSNWAKMILGDAGPCAWAIGSQELQAELARLKSVAIETEGPSSGSRKRPDGKVIEWETARIGPGAPGAVLPFMIEDKTPRELRARPSAGVQGSPVTGIAVVVIGVKDLDAASALFRRAYGWSAPAVEGHKEFGARLAYFTGSPVMLATPLDQKSWLAERLQAFGEHPVAYLLGARDLSAASSRFGLSAQSKWFGRNLAWFDAKKLRGVRLGVVE